MNKKVSIGSWITIGHPSIAEIMANSDLDWLCIDMEHTVIDYYQAQQIITAIQGKQKEAYVRVGDNNPRIIKRMLDAGANGIIVPMINSAEEALKARDSVYYPPIGKRGVGLARGQEYGFNFDKYYNQQKNIKLIVQIEHFEAIENLEEILAIDGIHGSFIGPYDLSGSIGKAGDFNNEKLTKLLKKYEKISKKMNKSMGFHVIEPNHKLLLEKINKGYSIIAFSFDAYLLGTKLNEELKNYSDFSKNDI
jgi:2-dehydro-3-deoxyglucarate aldolase